LAQAEKHYETKTGAVGVIKEDQGYEIPHFEGWGGSLAALCL